MYCNLKVNNGSVVVYYGKKGIMRFPTGVKISKEKNARGQFVEWDYKNNCVKKHVNKSIDSNEIIKNYIDFADSVVKEHLEQGVTIGADDLKKHIAVWISSKRETKTGLVLDHYVDFMEKKHKQLVERSNKQDISFVTYTTFKSTINDYEFENNIKLTIYEINTEKWLSNFHSWLQKKRPSTLERDGVTYKFKTRGQAKSATVDKRFEVMTGFFSYLLEKKLIPDINVIANYKKLEVNVVQKVKTTLTIDEIHNLYNYKCLNEDKDKVKLIFLFSCLTGFRWKDIENFNKSFIREVKGNKVYKHIANKTKNTKGKEATIPLCKLSLKILVDLDYKLNVFTNANANKLLHQLLKESGLFDELTLSVDEITGKNKFRYELLSMHRGRDTFITNLISTVPLHELMSYTSHEKLSTLQKYIDYTREINPEYVSIFDK
jgi:integrase